MTTSLLETCNKIWFHLRKTGPITTDALCEELGVSSRECGLAVAWLANRNMIDIVEEQGQAFLCWTDSEQGFGG
ncbi:MAG: winged helix-turn-helix domain-containing protein [Candidatus Hydrogenedentes bacterium]|nr:winged helix-turn-helix domain-containing protein [Candidatus Hydrogenedentota bacterium]